MTNEQNNTEQKCSVFTTTNDPAQVNQAKGIAIRCDNCKKDITLDDIKALCPTVIGQKINGKEWEEWMKDGITCLNKYRKQVGIDTCVAKAHFLAQLALESNFYRIKENFDYYWPELVRLFKMFKTTEGKEKAKLWGRAEKESPAVSSTNQINIANWAYQKDPNKKKDNGNGDFASGDGYKYRGRGFIQLTFKNNYIAMTTAFNKLVQAKNDENNKNDKSAENEVPVDWLNNPDNLGINAKDAMAASLAFWSANNISKLAIYNSAKCVEVVTSKINAALDNLDKRIVFFKQAVDLLQVNECQKELFFNGLPADRKGTVVVVSGIGSTKVKGWVVYETSIYRYTSLERYKQKKQDETELKADKIIYLARDAHQEKDKKNKLINHANERYGYNNETPPGEYYLVLKHKQASTLYISDDASKVKRIGRIKVNEKIDRTDLAITGKSPDKSVGELTTVNKSITSELINDIPDLYAVNGRVIIIIEEREVEEGSWVKKGNPQIINKWTGVLPTPKAPDDAQTP